VGAELVRSKRYVVTVDTGKTGIGVIKKTKLRDFSV